MDRSELRSLGKRLLKEARAIRGAYPDADTMRESPLSDVPTASFGDDHGAATFWAALGYLRAEMALVRNGKAGTLTVLEDEIANVESMVFQF